MTAIQQSCKQNRTIQTLRSLAGTAMIIGVLTSHTGCNKPNTESGLSNDGSIAAKATNTIRLLDDYSDPVCNTSGAARLLIDDKTTGSQSRADQKIDNGVLSVSGELIPGRGVPAFISLVSPLADDGTPENLSGYQGVRIVVKVTQGMLCVQVASSVIENYDYHTSAPISGAEQEFKEILLPFTDLKRAWSGQTRLDLKSITSVNLVSFSVAREAFAYQVDEISFY